MAKKSSRLCKGKSPRGVNTEKATVCKKKTAEIKSCRVQCSENSNADECSLNNCLNDGKQSLGNQNKSFYKTSSSRLFCWPILFHRNPSDNVHQTAKECSKKFKFVTRHVWPQGSFFLGSRKESVADGADNRGKRKKPGAKTRNKTGKKEIHATKAVTATPRAGECRTYTTAASPPIRRNCLQTLEAPYLRAALSCPDLSYARKSEPPTVKAVNYCRKLRLMRQSDSFSSEVLFNKLLGSDGSYSDTSTLSIKSYSIQVKRSSNTQRSSFSSLASSSTFGSYRRHRYVSSGSLFKYRGVKIIRKKISSLL